MYSRSFVLFLVRGSSSNVSQKQRDLGPPPFLQADSILQAGFCDFYGGGNSNARRAASNSMPGAHCQLPFIWRHLIPQDLQVFFDAGILWVLAQRSTEPAVGSR